MRNPNDQVVTVKCSKCGLSVQVPVGGRRLCGCGTWLSGDVPIDVLEAEPVHADGTAARFPRIDGDLSAIDRLNEGYRRIPRDMPQDIVGQPRVLEELPIPILAAL